MVADQLLGRQIDAFTVEERIGQGGMASVYRAFQASINRSVALKVITISLNQSEQDEFRARFAQEAQMIAALEHIHILPIYDYGIVDNELAYIAMRLLRGGTLADLLAEQPLELEYAADVFTQIARGLNYAHSKGVIHRDLKPSNILFDESGNAYLADFGLAKMVEGSLHLTKSDRIVGTPTYMAPEQLRGDPIDQRADIYSLGGILYHMLVGRPPFEASGSNVISMLYQQLEKAPPPPRQLNPAIPPAVEQIILRALQKAPGDRYPSAEAMANALNQALGRRPSTSNLSLPRLPHRPASATNAVPKQGLLRSRAFVISAIALQILALILGVVVVLPQVINPPPTAATIHAGEVGVAADSVPTADEIQRAQARLGENGFIAHITCNQTSQYHAAQTREIAQMSAQYGLKERIYDSNSEKYTEISQIERARADGATGLIVCPLDMTSLADTLTSVQQAKLPLVLLTSGGDSYGGVLISGDDYLIGQSAGRAAGEIINDELGGHAEVIILDYPDLDYLVRRADGLEAGLLEVAPEAHIIGRYLGATADNGQQSVSRLIAQGVKFNVILSINDAGSYGAIAALVNAGYDPSSVIVSSVDAESVARQYIRQGYFMRASVVTDRQLSSQTAVNAMVKLLAGSTLPQTYLVPPGSVITRANLEVTEAAPS